MDTIIIAAVFVIYLGVMVVIGMSTTTKKTTCRIYPGREKASAHCCGHVSSGVGYERMASDGTSGTGLHTLRRHIGSYLDCRWTGIGNISQLALRRQEAEKVYSGGGERITLPDLFENRFRDKKHILRMYRNIYCDIFIVYTSSQMVAGGKLFTTVFDMDYTLGMIIVAIIVLAYTALGGFTAVCWTDTIQGIIRFFALLIDPIVACVMWEALAR